MAENEIKVADTFEVNSENKQFNLKDSFDTFARVNGLNDQSIKSTRAEIESRFIKYNVEIMNDRRFRSVQSTIEGLINNEIWKAKSTLLAKSWAFEWTSIKWPKIPINTPWITNTTIKPKIGNISQAISGWLWNILKARNDAIDNATK